MTSADAFVFSILTVIITCIRIIIRRYRRSISIKVAFPLSVDRWDAKTNVRLSVRWVIRHTVIISESVISLHTISVINVIMIE